MRDGLRRQPLIKPLANKGIIVQMGICGIDAIDFRELSTAERLMRIQAPDPLQNSLAPQHFVQARNASGKIVGGVKKGGVAIGDLQTCPQEISRNMVLC